MFESKLYYNVQKVLRFISVALMAVALSLSFLVIIQSLICPFHVIAGSSMSPAMNTGDAVFMKDVDTHNVNVGEVIVFFDPINRGTLVIHRVVAKDFHGDTPVYTTKGDNNPVADPAGILPGMIVGAPARNFPHFGHLLDFLTTGRGYLACVIIPGALALIIAFALGFVERFEKPCFNTETTISPYYGRKLMNLQ